MTLGRLFSRGPIASTPSLRVAWPRSAAFGVLATRDDVHPGDGAQPRRFTALAGAGVADVLREAADPRWLPSLHESVVVWLVTSTIPLAVVEHDCRGSGVAVAIRQAPGIDSRMAEADWSGGELRLTFNYDPRAEAERLYEDLARPG